MPNPRCFLADFCAKGPLLSLLNAFITPAKTLQLRKALCDGNKAHQLENLWLLSPSIHSAFRNGHVHVIPFTGPWTWHIAEDDQKKTMTVQVGFSPMDDAYFLLTTYSIPLSGRVQRNLWTFISVMGPRSLRILTCSPCIRTIQLLVVSQALFYFIYTTCLLLHYIYSLSKIALPKAGHQLH